MLEAGMRFPWRSLALAVTAPLLLATACTTGGDPDGVRDDDVDYRSTTGQEFTLSTTVTFPLPEAAAPLTGEEKEKAVVLRAEQLRTSVTSAISAELDRIWPQAERTSRAGVVVQFRQASATYGDLAASADGTRYTMTVSGEFAGVKDLEKKLPMKTADGQTFLPVSTDVGAGVEELRVLLTPVERSRNAYPRYLELFEGGLDIGVHVGGDHHDPPQDINHARSVYADLVASGFRSPVARFEDLALDSGPLTRTIRVRSEDVEVRVRIYHPDLTPPEARQPLVDAYRNSMKNDDVVVYDGHAGRRLDYSGVVLAYKPSRVSIPATELAEIEARSPDKQQIYLFNGCETYTGYADKLYENPSRDPANTDVITTANYSAIYQDARQVIAFLHALVDEKGGAWVPRSWDSVLSRMNTAGDRAWVHVYGVHGIDDDPKTSPLADPAKLGAACRTDADCGGDSLCLTASATSRVCGIACADSAGCPSGTTCVQPRGRTSLDDLQCAPQ